MRQWSTARRLVSMVENMATTVGSGRGQPNNRRLIMSRRLSTCGHHVTRCPRRRQDLLLARRAGRPGDLAAGRVEHQRRRRTQDAEAADELEVVLGVDLEVLDPGHHARPPPTGSAGSPGRARRTPRRTAAGWPSRRAGRRGSTAVTWVQVVSRLGAGAPPPQPPGPGLGAAEAAVGEQPVEAEGRGRATTAATTIQAPVLTSAQPDGRRLGTFHRGVKRSRHAVTASTRRGLLIVLVGYSALLGVALLAPTSGTQSAMASWVSDLGIWVGFSPETANQARAEFLCNVAILAPVSALGLADLAAHDLARLDGVRVRGRRPRRAHPGAGAPGRTASYVDIVANTLGGLVGAVVCWRRGAQPPANGGRNSTDSPGCDQDLARVLGADRPVADQRRADLEHLGQPGAGVQRDRAATTSASVIGPSTGEVVAAHPGRRARRRPVVDPDDVGLISLGRFQCDAHVSVLFTTTIHRPKPSVAFRSPPHPGGDHS